MSADRARVTTFVAVEPTVAFEVFTEEIDRWWRRGLRYRVAKNGTMRFEGGKLVEVLDDGDVREIGRVLAWEPGARLVFEWRAANFTKTQVTEVEVRFEKTGSGTRVTLEHRGWDGIPEDHPSRHGLDPRASVASMGSWWGELLLSFRELSRGRA